MLAASGPSSLPGFSNLLDLVEAGVEVEIQVERHDTFSAFGNFVGNETDTDTVFLSGNELWCPYSSNFVSDS